MSVNLTSGRNFSIVEPLQRVLTPSLVAGLASKLKIGFHPYGTAQHCRYRQNIPRGLPRGGFKHYRLTRRLKPKQKAGRLIEDRKKLRKWRMRWLN